MQDAAKLLSSRFWFSRRGRDRRPGDRSVSTGQSEAAAQRRSCRRSSGSMGRSRANLSPVARPDIAALWASLDAGRMSGVARIDGEAKQIVAAPILTPVLTGWILFASSLDAGEMRSLEKLSAIPLNAGVIVKQDGQWSRVAGAFALSDSAASLQIDASLSEPSRLRSRPCRRALDRRRKTPADDRRWSDAAALLLFYLARRSDGGLSPGPMGGRLARPDGDRDRHPSQLARRAADQRALVAARCRGGPAGRRRLFRSCGCGRRRARAPRQQLQPHGA